MAASLIMACVICQNVDLKYRRTSTRLFALEEVTSVAPEKGKKLCISLIFYPLHLANRNITPTDSAAILLMVSQTIVKSSLLLSFSGADYGLWSLIACGVGCQYGDCDAPIPWAPLPAAPPLYADGACMREVFNHFFHKTDHHPVCRAKEVSRFT